MDIGSWLTPQGWYVLAAMMFASITANYKYQWQAFFYLLVVINVVYTVEGLFLVSLWYLVLILISGAIRASKE